MSHTSKSIANSIPEPKRTFRAWLMEMKTIASGRMRIGIERAKMFYNSGYSPKMVVFEELRIPVGCEVL